MLGVPSKAHAVHPASGPHRPRGGEARRPDVGERLPEGCHSCELETMEQNVKDLAVRCFLLGALPREQSELPTYGDLAKLFGGVPNGQGPLLERLANQCAERREPDLTVLVVNKNGLPSRFERRNFDRDPQTVKRWRAAVRRAQKFPWSNADL